MIAIFSGIYRKRLVKENQIETPNLIHWLGPKGGLGLNVLTLYFKFNTSHTYNVLYNVHKETETIHQK